MYLWKILKERSSVQIKVGYLRFGVIVAEFRELTCEVKSLEELNDTEIYFAIDVTAVDSGDQKIDEMIRASAFFDGGTYRYISFKSVRGCYTSSGGIRELRGELTIKSYAQEVIFIVTARNFKKTGDSVTAELRLYAKIQLENFSVKLDSGEELADEMLITVSVELKRVNS